MCVCVCVCVGVHMCVCVYAHVCMRMCVSVSVCVGWEGLRVWCVHLWERTCLCVVCCLIMMVSVCKLLHYAYLTPLGWQITEIVHVYCAFFSEIYPSEIFTQFCANF